MNKSQRKDLVDFMKQIYEILTKLEEMKDIEQDKFDNLPENIQYSDKGQKFEDNVEALDNIIDLLNDATDSLSDIINS